MVDITIYTESSRKNDGTISKISFWCDKDDPLAYELVRCFSAGVYDKIFRIETNEHTLQSVPMPVNSLLVRSRGLIGRTISRLEEKEEVYGKTTFIITARTSDEIAMCNEFFTQCLERSTRLKYKNSRITTPHRYIALFERR